MNNQQSPLVPQGSLLEQKNRGRARVKIAVFFVLAVHGIGLMALLMQGCRREEPAATQQTNDVTTASNPVPPMMDTNPPVADTNPPVAPPTGTVSTTTSVVPTPTDLGALTEYKVAKGDSFTTIGRKFHVSAKAIADANPGVDSSKLQIGQTLKIPAAGAATATASTGTTDNGSAGQTYKVKSGDTLTKIAGQFGVTVRAIENANGLKTSKITVGQALKIPAKAGGSTTSTSAPPTTTPAPTTPQP